MAASTSCSALIGSAPWICERRRRERLAETLAPVGPQAPPAPSARFALDSASERRGALLWTTGTSGVRANLSIMSPNTCSPCLLPLHGEREGGRRPSRCLALQHLSQEVSQPVKVLHPSAAMGSYLSKEDR